MVGILELNRYEWLIDRELIRRIGYTNGLHDINRFARVVEYLYPKIPVSQAVFRRIIKENEVERDSTSKISDEKYLQGIIDVAGALSLVNKKGQKLFLSDRGYSLHALKQDTTQSDNYTEIFLLMSILDADGEYILNILDIISKDYIDNRDVGILLFDRMMKIFEIKLEWAKNDIDSTISRITINNLEEAQKKLKKALDPSSKNLMKSRSLKKKKQLSGEKRVETFRGHIIMPRLKWLIDLNCMKKNNGKNEITESGRRLLNFFKKKGCLQREVYILPVSPWLSKVLGVKKSENSPNIFWESVATAFCGQVEKYQFKEEDLLDFIREIYPHVKLFGFDQVEISSIYHALSCREAIKGNFIGGGEEEFNKKMEEITKIYPKDIFWLSKRRGQGGYISLKK
jgi:hypothetical protein